MEPCQKNHLPMPACKCCQLLLNGTNANITVEPVKITRHVPQDYDCVAAQNLLGATSYLAIFYVVSLAKCRSHMVSIDVDHFTNGDLSTEIQDLSTSGV